MIVLRVGVLYGATRGKFGDEGSRILEPGACSMLLEIVLRHEYK